MDSANEAMKVTTDMHLKKSSTYFKNIKRLSRELIERNKMTQLTKCIVLCNISILVPFFFLLCFLAYTGGA